MSVKDVKEYYDQICDQYMEMQESLKDLSRECENNLVEPERIENAKKIIEPLMTSYETLSWVMFLLKKPVKKSKHKCYINQNKKLLSKLNADFSKESILNKNKQVIEKLDQNTKGGLNG